MTYIIPSPSCQIRHPVSPLAPNGRNRHNTVSTVCIRLGQQIGQSDKNLSLKTLAGDWGCVPVAGQGGNGVNGETPVVCDFAVDSSEPEEIEDDHGDNDG